MGVVRRVWLSWVMLWEGELGNLALRAAILVSVAWVC